LSFSISSTLNKIGLSNLNEVGAGVALLAMPIFPVPCSLHPQRNRQEVHEQTQKQRRGYCYRADHNEEDEDPEPVSGSNMNLVDKLYPRCNRVYEACSVSLKKLIEPDNSGQGQIPVGPHGVCGLSYRTRINYCLDFITQAPVLRFEQHRFN
jgi:hypothetical protein